MAALVPETTWVPPVIHADAIAVPGASASTRVAGSSPIPFESFHTRAAGVSAPIAGTNGALAGARVGRRSWTARLLSLPAAAISTQFSATRNLPRYSSSGA